jgi:hypothetical protein
MSVNENEIKAAKEFLKSYSVCKQMLDADEYAESYGGAEPRLCDRIILRAKMSRVEDFIRSLPVCREQNLLFCHYVGGHSVEFCGEMMYLSRRTAYRVLDRAHRLVAERLSLFGNFEGECS